VRTGRGPALPAGLDGRPAHAAQARRRPGTRR
jgi:hypothetical protein